MTVGTPPGWRPTDGRLPGWRPTDGRLPGWRTADAPPRALLLDFDGTLVDSLPALRAVYFGFLTDRGATPSEAEFQSLNGPPLPEIVRRLTATHGLVGDTLEADYRERVSDAYLHHVRVAHGAADLLATARRLGLRAVVVTACPASLCRAALSRMGLDWLLWDVVDCAMTSHPKPAGDVYRLALARCGVDAPDALAVEDSPAGLAAARAAGIQVIDAAEGLHAVEAALLAACADRPFVAWPGALPPVLRGGPVALGEVLDRRVDTFWAEALAARPGLFDGPVDFLHRWTHSALETRTGSYRHYLAARRDPAVARALGGPPLAVSGLVRRGDEVLLGRRAAHVTQYPDHWELVPAGGLGDAPTGDELAVDVAGALRQELHEEAGLVGSVGAPLGVVFDTVDPVVDLCAVLEVPAVPAAGGPSGLIGTDEYPRLAWHALDGDAPLPCVPTSAALLGQARARLSLRPAVPEDRRWILALRNRPEVVAVSNRRYALAPHDLPDPLDPSARVWVIDTPPGSRPTDSFDAPLARSPIDGPPGTAAPLGHVTAQLDPPDTRPRTATLGIALQPDAQRRGLGPAALLEACARLKREGIEHAIAHIFADNTASQRAFTRAGFTLNSTEAQADGRTRQTWRRVL